MHKWLNSNGNSENQINLRNPMDYHWYSKYIQVYKYTSDYRNTQKKWVSSRVHAMDYGG